MRNLSTEFKEQQNSGNRNYLKYADFTFTDGSTLSITDKDLWSNGFKFEDAVSQSGSFDIGAAIVNKLTLQINNFSGKYTDYIWDGARVVCHIGLELSTGIEKIRICTMAVTDAPYQNTAIISLTCEDSMRLFDRDYSDSKLTYPVTRLQIIQDACEVCGVTLQSTRFDNDDFIIQNRPVDSSITFRQVIAWVAQMGCQWAKSDEYGRLCLGWYEREVPDKFYNLVETPWKDTDGNDILDTTGAQIITIMQKGITSTDTNGFTPWLYDLEITGVKVTEYVENSSQNEAKTYQSGKSGYVIEISDNKLIQEGTGEEICKIIADRCVGLKFRPFTTGALTNIAWEAGDTISISDRNGNVYKSYLTSVTLNPGNFEQLECSAKSVSRSNQKQYTLNQQIQAENKKNLKDERAAREKALEELSQRLAESSGTYTTVETQPDGSNIYYLHNKPQLSDSDIVWKMTAEAWAVSTDGGQHWNGGMTVDGDVIARILTATGVNADWINTGTIKAIDKDGNTTFLVDITTGRVIINADSVQIKGKDVNAIAKEKAEAEVNDFISNTYTSDINNLQSQIDGQIETFFYDYEPTLQNTPASEWTTNEERKKHEGDLFYWKSKGYAYRFMQDGATWKWQLVQDTDITLALAAAEKAQDTANGKRRVFVVQPEPPYDIGDLWAQGSTGDLMRCKVARASGVYSAEDWEKASKYTDDSSLNLFINGVFKDSLNSLKTQIDGKIETWYQPNDPSVKWIKTEEYPWCDIDGNKILDESGNEIVLVWESEKAEHEGDLWHNTSDNTQWIYKSGVWKPQSIPDALLDKVDGKSSVYTVQPTPPYYSGDLWMTTDSDGKASLKVTQVNRLDGTFNDNDWIDFKYADKDDIKKAIDNYDTSLGQDEVFNKLTKGGVEQGIYIEDGKVYINAKYILAGLLAGERINGRGLKVIDDDKNVTLEIDSKGNVILAPKTFSLQGKTVKEIADSSASTAVSGQTQADIFSKLTNGGKAQGIYLDENGNVYVNGEYVQAKGIKVVDGNGKTTFAIDKTTGAVTIAASNFALGDKSIADIASEEAQKKIDALPRETDNLVKGYGLSESDVQKYWNIVGTPSYGQSDPAGGTQALMISNLTTGNNFLEAKVSDNPIFSSSGRYNVSFWLKANETVFVNNTYVEVEVYFNGALIDTIKAKWWVKYNYSVDVTSVNKSSPKLYFKFKKNSYTKNTILIYRPEVTFGYTSTDIFNMLTNNGAMKGLYMVGNELYFSFTYAQGGTLKLGGVNNGNGLLSILNASGTQVGYIDNTGVHFNQGEFSGNLKSNTGEIGNWQIDKINGKLTSANGAIVLDAKNNMVTINGVDLKANGNGFVIDGGVKIKNTTDSSGFADETSFFCLENLGAITDGTHLGVNSSGMVIKVPSSSWRYKSIRTTVKEEELEELYRTKVVWAKYKEGYLDKNDSRYDKLMPMFLAEDMERRFPIAVNHLPDGKPEDWNYRIMIPSMFAMIKFNHEKIKELKSENEELKSELKSIKEELAEIKQLLSKSV
nr:MAG TPA: Putative tail protein [Caudoviricetes sp.]